VPSAANVEAVLPYLYALAAMIGVAALLFFRRNRNARLKRAVWIALIVLADLVFLGLVLALRAPGYFIALALAVSLVGAWRSIRLTRFCPACGGNHFPIDSGTAPTECRHCGASLAAPAQR